MAGIGTPNLRLWCEGSNPLHHHLGMITGIEASWLNRYNHEKMLISLKEICQVVLEEKIFRYAFLLFQHLSPWKWATPLIWSLPKDALCHFWLKLAPWFRGIRWKHQLCISAILLLSPLGKTSFIHLMNLNSFHLRTKFESCSRKNALWQVLLK